MKLKSISKAISTLPAAIVGVAMALAAMGIELPPLLFDEDQLQGIASNLTAALAMLVAAAQPLLTYFAPRNEED